jgi:MATE family multidrug resistance protein
VITNDISTDKQTPGTVILLGVAIAHVPVCWSVVHYWGFGLIGGTLATGSMYWIACLFIGAYIWLVDGSQAWSAPSLKVFEDMGSLVRLVGFGITMVGAEWYDYPLLSSAVLTRLNS